VETKLRHVLGAAGTAALLTYFLDPQRGRRRRHVARDRTAAAVRRLARTGDRRRRYLSGKAAGIAHRAAPSRRPPGLPDDVTLARKVETVLFRDRAVPKGRIVIGVAGGVVTLRGEADTPEMIRELERRAGKVDGVLAVENLLHLRSTPAPHTSGSA